MSSVAAAAACGDKYSTSEFLLFEICI